MDESGVFVTLTPSNEEAIRAFSKVVNRISTDPHHFEHHRQFMISSVTRSPISSLLRGTSVASTGGSGTDPEAETTTTEKLELVWTGNYQISLQAAPQPPAAGWRAGSGRWTERNPTGDIELFLSCEKSDGIRGKHARFIFDRNTGILMLNAFHTAQSGVKLNASQFGREDRSRPLTAPTAIIQMGKLEYRFAYTNRPK